jgi:hypothetical protein
MKTLNDVFNIEPSDIVEKANTDLITQSGEVIVPHEVSNIEKNIDSDYERTRQNLHTLLCQGQDALTSALDVAKQSESPRAFEVVGSLVKQLADINHQLLDLSEKRQKLVQKSSDDQNQQKNVTNNNAFFVGSTAELNKLIHNMKGE